MVAHALHNGAEYSDNQRAAWWHQLRLATLKFDVQLLLLDANARVGEITSCAIGDFGFRQPEDASGTLFHDYLLST
eukprot:9491935-Pyramimonas_sp.AAC.1